MTTTHDDAANDCLRNGPKPMVLDAEAMGRFRAPSASVATFLDANPLESMTTIERIIDEDQLGIEKIMLTRPHFGYKLRCHSQKMYAKLHHVIISTDHVNHIVANFLDDARVQRRLINEPRRTTRAMLAAVSIDYGLPIISGSGFFVRLDEVIRIQAGVYDPGKGEWIVAPLIKN
ncbi:hypothetical protein LJR009_002882 [Bosea sp. LjRoot9]|uniref:hypothetical protein n=1 Tax=Bosea sp. LjRoot9 TaxID=3342341 RepID=UPI003ECC9BCC